MKMKEKKDERVTTDFLQKVVDTFNEPAFVMGMEDCKIIFVNKKFAEVYGYDCIGSICWKKLRKNQHGPCEDCSNPLLVDENKVPSGIFHSTFKCDVTGNWYQCTDQAFEWFDNKLVALKTAQDITALKNAAEKNRTLLKQNKELTWQIVHILDEERRKLSRNLHDEIGQIGTGIKLNADYLLMKGEGQDRDQEEVETIKDIAYQATRLLILLKQICANLDPFTVSRALTLQEMLEGVFEEWSLRNRDIRASLNIDVGAVQDDMDNAFKVTVYHVLQESLTNITKHAKATQVNVQCTVKEDLCGGKKYRSLVLVIDDNGVGLSEKDTDVGLGLIYMKERVAMLQGQLDIVTSPLGGVRVKVQLPVLKNTDELLCIE